MKSKISKVITIAIVTILGMSLFGLSPIAHAAGDVCSQGQDKIPPEVWEAAGCNGNTNALPSFIVGILNAIILVCGLIAVIYVIIGGINYMTSAGDAGKLEKAKKTILYACIGLIIVVLSFAIVNFTISNIISGHSNQETTEQKTTTQKQQSTGHPSEN